MSTTNTDNPQSPHAGAAPARLAPIVDVRCPRCRHLHQFVIAPEINEMKVLCPACQNTFEWVRPDSRGRYGAVPVPRMETPSAEAVPAEVQAEEEETDEPRMVYCLGCGNSIMRGGNFCPICGFSQNNHASRMRMASDTITWRPEGSADAPEPFYIRQPFQKNATKMLHLGWTILSVLLVIIGFLSAILMWFHWQE